MRKQTENMYRSLSYPCVFLSYTRYQSKILFDSTINPGMPVTDARTHIHGITEEQIASSTMSIRQAQAVLLNMCPESTIIIGHSVHSDLKSLRFAHR